LEEIKYLVNHSATVPSKAHATDSGFDLIATSCSVHDKNSDILVYGTGIRVQIPAGFELQLRPRSSIRNYDLILINSPGTIDQEYTGEIMVSFRKIPRSDGTIRTYSVGDKIAQVVLTPVVQAVFVPVLSLETTERGSKGFGSSGV